MRYGFLGAGRMASAIIRGIISARVCRPGDIMAFDRDEAVLDLIGSETGIEMAKSNTEVVSAAEVLLLCVKPADVVGVLNEIRTAKSNALLVSIAAGVPLSRLEELAPGHRVIRVMPNTPALIHKGAAAYALGSRAMESDADIVQEIFSAVGLAVRVDEKHMNAVTGLSGSGPAYVYVMVEALADGGVLQGLPRSLALQLAAQTVAGAAQMVMETAEHPAQLKDNVASPGGTTIAGLAVLEACAVRSAFIEAVASATERSMELAAETK